MSAIEWIIFDADNTLWDVEYLYDEARTEFCEYALELLDQSRQRGTVTLDLLEKAQRHRDIQLHKTHGYSSSRFARSFEDTLLFFMQYAPAEGVIHVRRIAQDVFEKPARLVDGLAEILDRLVGRYHLAIITAGEEWVQRKRIDQFHLSKMFKEIIIVERKSAEVFKKFCQDKAVPPENCWLVGDSVRSDVLTAKEAGLKVIHLQAPNWAAEHEQLPPDTPSVKVLADILPILL